MARTVSRPLVMPAVPTLPGMELAYAWSGGGPEAVALATNTTWEQLHGNLVMHHQGDTVIADTVGQTLYYRLKTFDESGLASKKVSVFVWLETVGAGTMEVTATTATGAVARTLAAAQDDWFEVTSVTAVEIDDTVEYDDLEIEITSIVGFTTHDLRGVCVFWARSATTLNAVTAGDPAYDSGFLPLEIGSYAANRPMTTARIQDVSTNLRHLVSTRLGQLAAGATVGGVSVASGIFPVFGTSVPRHVPGGAVSGGEQATARWYFYAARGGAAAGFVSIKLWYGIPSATGYEWTLAGTQGTIAAAGWYGPLDVALPSGTKYVRWKVEPLDNGATSSIMYSWCAWWTPLSVPAAEGSGQAASDLPLLWGRSTTRRSPLQEDQIATAQSWRAMERTIDWLHREGRVAIPSCLGEPVTITAAEVFYLRVATLPIVYRLNITVTLGASAVQLATVDVVSDTDPVGVTAACYIADAIGGGREFYLPPIEIGTTTPANPSYEDLEITITPAAGTVTVFGISAWYERIDSL